VKRGGKQFRRGKEGSATRDVHTAGRSVHVWLTAALMVGCASGMALDDGGVDAEVNSPIDAAPPVDGPARNQAPDAAPPDAAPNVAPDAAPDGPQGPCASPTSEGMVCDPAPDLCHTDGTCHNGTCGAIGVRPNGYNYAAGADNRCCGGRPVQVNTSQHCGVCGISCGTSACVNVGGAWQCSCTASADCWSNCCSTSAGAPYVCVPSTCGNPASCIACPGGGTCTETTPHYYCHY